MNTLSISIVTYKTDEIFLKKCLQSLNKACIHSIDSKKLHSVNLFIIDNSSNKAIFDSLQKQIDLLWTSGQSSCIQMNRNVGYGNAHNHAIEKIDTDYHLALNPDVDLKLDTISEAIAYLEENKDVGLISPYVENEDREYLYLCKRYPNVLVLFLRGFFPTLSKNIFSKKLATYEMRDCDIVKENKEVLIASGCFMFFRVSELKKLNGFCKKFFLYFEDFDLSYRMSAMSKVAYVPSVKIVHHGGYAAAKGINHIYLFCRSSFTFFNRYGWKLY